jgi:stage VI sporulation protein D
MTDLNNNSSLTFSVEESVWFQKGQEVKEVLSMSLEPEIAIEDRGDHISITGGLQLIGEYEPQAESEASLREIVHSHTVENVTISEDGICELSHRFPVDITIPTHKVRSLDDIYVVIDSFDYDIPEEGCLKLSADIIISGIEQEAVRDNDYNETQGDLDNVVPLNNDQPETDHFEVETRKLPNEEEEVAHNEMHDEEQEQVVETYSPHIEMKSRVEDTNAHTSSENSYWNNDVNNENELYENSYRNNSTDNQEEDSHQEKVSNRTSSRQSDENALYLTKMLSGDEDDQQARLRMCIAQAGESLEEIAERYKVSISQLLRVNKLDTEDINEGQIIYIPSSVQSI